MPAVASHRPTSVPRDTFTLLLALVIASLVLVFGPVTAAQAHGDESEVSSVLVLQSISIIVNEGTADAAAEKLDDALKAPEKEGTDLVKVKEALEILEGAAPGAAGAPDLARARAILVGAITVRPATGYGKMPEPGMVGTDVSPFASGAETGTAVVLDGLKPARGISDGGDAALLGLAIVALILGVYLSYRWRPEDTIRQLRRKSGQVVESA